MARVTDRSSTDIGRIAQSKDKGTFDSCAGVAVQREFVNCAVPWEPIVVSYPIFHHLLLPLLDNACKYVGSTGQTLCRGLLVLQGQFMLK